MEICPLLRSMTLAIIFPCPKFFLAKSSMIAFRIVLLLTKIFLFLLILQYLGVEHFYISGWRSMIGFGILNLRMVVSVCHVLCLHQKAPNLKIRHSLLLNLLLLVIIVLILFIVMSILPTGFMPNV